MSAYSAVTWTTGDIITEAKLDNMVSNDQSEDAHESNGLQLANNVAYKAKQAGGTVKDVMKLGTDDILRLSQMRYQKRGGDGTLVNSTEENVVIQSGWGSVTGDGTARSSAAVTFPTAFDTILTVVPGNLATKATTFPTEITDLVTPTGANTAIVASIEDVTTSGFNLYLHRSDSTILATSSKYGFSWIAIGVTA